MMLEIVANFFVKFCQVAVPTCYFCLFCPLGGMVAVHKHEHNQAPKSFSLLMKASRGTLSDCLQHLAVPT
jgi:hypothetical protein